MTDNDEDEQAQHLRDNCYLLTFQVKCAYAGLFLTTISYIFSEDVPTTTTIASERQLQDLKKIVK